MNYALIDRRFSAPIAEIIKSGFITPEDVCSLRTEIFPHGITTEDQAYTLISLEKFALNSCSAWADYYLTSLSDFILCHRVPVGSVDRQNSQWIADNIMRHGYMRTKNEFLLLKLLLERAVSASPCFCKLVLSQMHVHMEDIGEQHNHYSKKLDQTASDFDLSCVDIIDQLNQADLFT